MKIRKGNWPEKTVLFLDYPDHTHPPNRALEGEADYAPPDLRRRGSGEEGKPTFLEWSVGMEALLADVTEGSVGIEWAVWKGQLARFVVPTKGQASEVWRNADREWRDQGGQWDEMPLPAVRVVTLQDIDVFAVLDALNSDWWRQMDIVAHIKDELSKVLREIP